MAIPNVIADFSTILALKVAIGATTATLVSATDSDGVALPTGTYGFTIDRKNSNKEYITCTLNGTSLTNISTIAVGTGVATSGFAKAHRRSAEVVLTDFVAIKRIQDVLETGYPSATTPTTDYQLATKKYVDDIALGGSTTVDRVTVVATCGENVTAGQLLYLKTSDSKWWKTDADTVTTIDNVPLGIAQGSGTTNGLITGGVLIKGVDANQTGLTANSIYYASNTAGAISATSGTVTRVIGIATSTTQIYFDPDFNKVYKNYAIDSASDDDYIITLQSAFGAYYAGMEISFKATTANTGACTLNVNSLGAKTIKKNVSSDLVTGDILANQIVKVVYDGTNFQMVSNLPPINPIVRTYTMSSVALGADIGSTTTQFDITNPSGSTFRYTYDGTGTDPNITSVTFPVGNSVSISSGSMSYANTGNFTIIASGANYFEVYNPNGVAENNKTLASGYLNQFTVATQATWTKPTGLKYAIVEVQGAGGQGGGNTSDSHSGGGGAGGYGKKLILAASLGSTETVTYGAPGYGKVINIGTSGGLSSFGTHIISLGGLGGYEANLNGRTGGTVTGGDINIQGQYGDGGSGDTGGSQEGGFGGSTILGFGGIGGADSAPSAGVGYGSGGGGGGATSARNELGGYGAKGIVIVTEFY